MDEKFPLISVIVPVYNTESYIYKCIESIRNQTYQNIEIILVDDGSKDQSGLICDHMSQKDTRIRAFHQKNQGPSSARNLGIEYSRGEFIAFVDSDDMVDPDMFSALYERINKDQSNIALCGYNRIDEAGSVLYNCTLPSMTVSGYEALKLYYDKNGELITLITGKLFDKRLFDGYKFKVGKCYEDDFLMYIIIDNCEKISIICKPMYLYLKRHNSLMEISNTTSPVSKLDRLEMLYERYMYYRDRGEDYREFLNADCALFARYYVDSKRIRPNNREEKDRVKEIDRMAYVICTDRSTEWSLFRKMKLLTPAVYLYCSKIKRKVFGVLGK